MKSGCLILADENWLDDEGECDTAEARESPTYTSTSKKCSYAIFIISESNSLLESKILFLQISLT